MRLRRSPRSSPMKEGGIEARDTAKAVVRQLGDLMGYDVSKARRPPAATTPAETLEANLWGLVAPESPSSC